MNTKKNIILILSIFFSTYYDFSQNLESLDSDKDFLNKEEYTLGKFGHIPETKLDAKIIKPLNFNLSVGTGFSFSNHIGSTQNFYISPNWSYKLSEKFQINFGTIVNFSNYSGVPGGLCPYNEFSTLNGGSTNILLYAEGTYFPSPRLTISGIAYKEIAPMKNTVLNPLPLDYNLEGMSLSFNYKLFDNLHIGAQFNYTNDYHPFLPYNPHRSYIDNYYW